MEQPCTFSCDDLTLEALFDNTGGDRAVVITHPHPLMGGDMHNPVVNSIRKAYREMGYSTLRFNFRGTGRSTGSHGEGVAEIRDVLAAGEFLAGQGMSQIHLSGYSFGAWVNLMCTSGSHEFKGLSLVSPPVDFIEFKDIETVDILSVVITGQHDAYASPSHIKNLLKKWNKNAILVEIPGADHFYGYELNLLEEALVNNCKPLSH